MSASRFIQVGILAAVGVVALQADEVVYESRWEKPGDPVGAEWRTNGRVEISPNGKRTFLSYVGQRQATLFLQGLPAHEVLRIECDLIVRGPWDGHLSPDGGDRVALWVDDERTLVEASFSNQPEERVEKMSKDGGKKAQSFPLGYELGASFGSCAGAAEVASLGYKFWEEEEETYIPMNSVYRLVFHVPHRAASMMFGLRCRLVNDKFESQDAGLDNVRVTTLSEGVSYSAAEWSKLVKTLEGDDVIAAHRAMWTMLASPARAKEYLDLGVQGGREDGAMLRALITDLSAEKFEARRAASRKLGGLPKRVIPQLKAMAIMHEDPETVVRLKQIVAKLEAISEPDKDPLTFFRTRMRELTNR